MKSNQFLRNLRVFFLSILYHSLNGLPTVAQTAFLWLFVDFVNALLRGLRKHCNLCFSLKKSRWQRFLGCHVDLHLHHLHSDTSLIL